MIPIVNRDFVDRAKNLEPLPDIGPRCALQDLAYVDDPPLFDLTRIFLTPLSRLLVLSAKDSEQ